MNHTRTILFIFISIFYFAFPTSATSSSSSSPLPSNYKMPSLHSTQTQTLPPPPPSVSNISPPPSTSTSTTSTSVYHPIPFLPLPSSDYKIFAPLSLLKFLIVFILTICRDTKDVLIVSSCGAEAIAFLKVYGAMPAAALYLIGYSWITTWLGTRYPARRNEGGVMNNSKKHRAVLFHLILVPFLVFFWAFTFRIYPNRDNLTIPIERSLQLVHSNLPFLPSSAQQILSSLLTHWPSSLFYILSDLLSAVSISLLFWSTALSSTPLTKTSLWYPLFGQISSIAPIVAGQFCAYVSRYSTDFETSLRVLTYAMLGCGGSAIASYWWVDGLDVEAPLDISDVDATPPSQSQSKKNKKPKPSLLKALNTLRKQPYLSNLSLLVLSQSLSLNLLEILYKSLLKRLYPTALEYQNFIGNLSSAVGAVTFLSIWLSQRSKKSAPSSAQKGERSGGDALRIMGLNWTRKARITPVAMAVTAFPFFLSVFYLGSLPKTLQSLSPTLDSGSLNIFQKFITNPVLTICVVLGTVLMLISKSCKYSHQDPSIQQAYLPLPPSVKLSAKASIDVLCTRIGKSGGAVMQQGFVMVCGGSIIGAVPLIVVGFYGVVGNWYRAAGVVGERICRVDVLDSVDDNDTEENKNDKIDGEEEGWERDKGKGEEKGKYKDE